MKSITSTRYALLALMLTGVAFLLSACGSSSTGQSAISNPAAQLKTLLVDPPSTTLALGLTTQFSATGIYTDGTQRDLTQAVIWTSSNPSVAVVSNTTNGPRLTTAVGQGTTEIRVSLGAVAGQATLTVGPPSLQFIAVTPLDASLARGATQQFTAIGIYSDESTRDLSNNVTWSSGNVAVATISNANGSVGLATGLGVGTTTISATLGSLTGSTPLTVAARTLVTIAVTPAGASITKGATQAFVATGTYTDGSKQNLNAQVTWNSTAPGVATINAAGLAATVGVGSTLITATLGSVTGSTSLTVSAAPLVSIAVSPQTTSVPKGATQTFVATGTYSDGSTQNLNAAVAWSSTFPSIATVNAAGLAASVAIGTTQITARLGGISGSASLTVNPAAIVSIAVTPTSPSIPKRSTQAFMALATYTDGTTQTVTPAAAWTSSNPGVATISNVPASVGVATGTGVGTTFIHATVSGIASPDVTLTVTPALQYVYALDGTGNDVLQFSIGLTGASAGILAPLTPPTLGAGGRPFSIAVDPSYTYLYVANYVTANIYAYQIGSGGTLTPVGSPVTTGAGPNGIAVDPSGQYVYTANVDAGTVSQFTANAGILTPMMGGDVTAGAGAASIAIDPSDSYVYVANDTDGSISEFTLGAGGALTPLSGTVTGLTNPDAIVIDPSGHYVYATNHGGTTLSEFSIGAGGLLQALTPATITTVSGSDSIAISPDGSFLYVTSQIGTGPGQLAQYSISAGGQLSLIATVPTGSVPQSVAVDPTGQYVYVTNRGAGTISQYTVNADGSLTPLGSPIPAGAAPTGIITAY